MSLFRVLPITLALVLAGAAPALAADGEQTPLHLDDAPAKAAGQTATSGGGLVRTIVGLAVVIAVIYGLTWVLRQVKRSREATASGTALSTLATLPLGPNRSLHLVRAGGEVVLVGSGEAGVTSIKTYGAAEARALGLVGDDDGDAPPGTTIADSTATDAGGSSLIAQLRRRTVIR